MNFLNGKKFSQLGSAASDLESTTIRCIILRRENPEEIIAEIFSRLNQGGVDLSDQEIRHALFPGKFNDLLGELAMIDEIKNFKVGHRGQTRKDSLEGEELVLRFFAMKNNLSSYEGNLKSFLDKYMKNQKALDETAIDKYREEFKSALQKCKIIFDSDELFTSLASQRRRQGLVYYDLQMTSLSEFSDKALKENKDEIRDAWKKMCASRDFKRLTEGGVQRKSAVGQRNRLWMEKVREIIK